MGAFYELRALTRDAPFAGGSLLMWVLRERLPLSKNFVKKTPLWEPFSIYFSARNTSHGVIIPIMGLFSSPPTVTNTAATRLLPASLF